MRTVQLVLMIVAAVLFLLAGIGVQSPRTNLLAWGLFFWAISVIVPFSQ